MKFSDGFWNVRKGFNVSSASCVYEVSQIDDNTVRILAPCHPMTEKWHSLSVTSLTVEMSSPAENILRVRARHFAGVQDIGPQFALNVDLGFKPDIAEDDGMISLQTGSLKVVFKKGNGWHMDVFKDGKRITGSGQGQLSYIKSDDGFMFMREQLDLAVGETVYGLGERFTPFVKNGQTVDMWNADGGTCSEQAYKNVPFYLTSGGYGVFVNHPEDVSFEIASEVVSRAQFSVRGESLDYFIIGGDGAKDVLERYTFLTGRPALPPAWSFGLWLSTSFTTNYDEETVMSFVNGMKERDIPLSVFHFDCFWMRAFRWCDFTWDHRVFPDPEGMLRRLKEKGLRVCVWINPYIGQESPLFREGDEHGYLVRNQRGDVWQTDHWQSGLAIVDFTNPGARTWYASKLDTLLTMGVDCFKTDFGELPPQDAVYFDGSDASKMHNYYSYLYNQTVTETVAKHRGKEDTVVFARSATAGGQQFPVHWGGDCSATYASMAETLRGGLSLGLSGFGFWSHDISGFESTATPDLYKRWAAFGLLSVRCFPL